MNRNLDIALLDFGQTKRLSETQRVGFVQLVSAMACKDARSIKNAMATLGIKVTSKKSRASDFNAKKARRSESKSKKEGNNLSLEEKLAYTMFDTATVQGVSDNPFSEDSALRSGTVSDLPKDLFFLLRTLQILKGLCKATYNSDFSMVQAWSAIAKQEARKLKAGV